MCESGSHGTGEDAILSPAAVPDAVGGPLQLSVLINAQPTRKIIGFIDRGDGRFITTRRELEEIGVRSPGGGPADQEIALDEIPDCTYTYDAANQRIDITMADANRIPKVYDARGARERAPASSGYGAVVNYSLFASGGAEDISLAATDFTGVNATLETRVFTPAGVLSQSGIVGDTIGTSWAGGEVGYMRLDTSYTYDDEEHLIRYRAGDLITGGPMWSRPVRLGGMQAQRSFSLRPDLVTQSLPSYSGSAAVPSTVDVYVNNAKAYSKDVGSGPFEIQNLPTISGAGTARVVVRDATGRETEETLSFYVTPTLLKPGLLDFSVETGYARRDYALDNSGYGDKLLITGSIKGGVTDDVTVEAHAEGGDGLVNGGAGIIARLGSLAVASAAASASSHEGKTGFQLHGSLDTRIAGIPVNLRTQRAYDDYEDLASLTAYRNLESIPGVLGSGALLGIEPPRAVDSAGISVPLEFDKSSIGVTFVRYEAEDGDVSNLVSASYSRPVTDRATFALTGYTDLADRNTAAVYAGVSMVLGNNISVSAGADRRGNDTGATVTATKSLALEPGSWGWQVRDSERRESYRSADLSYRGAFAKVRGGLTQQREGMRGTLEVDGALATLGGGFYASNRIDDAFAVVDAGAPGIRILRENSPIGETGPDGTLLVTDLTSYHENKVEIDSMSLPLNASARTTNQRVTPAFRSGVYVDFEVDSVGGAAIVVLTDTAGKFLELGSTVKLEGSDEPFMVGYDGQTYLTGLKAENTIVVSNAAGTCRASFVFSPQTDTQQTIGPEVCQ